MSSHSAILGGSTAARLLACPASYLESQRAPVVDIESEYAAEGTMLHTVITACVKQRITAADLRAGRKLVKLPHIISIEQADALAVALDELERLKALYASPTGQKWRVLALEKLLPLPGVTGAFGSVDLILVNDVAVIVVDWKFGRGVPVFALYQLGDGTDQLNAQTAFYACAGRGAHKRLFKDRKIVCAIVQPRLDPPMSHTETDNDELDGFLVSFKEATLEALQRGAHMERGEHCRFAVCKSVCPLWVAPVLDLSALEPNKAALQASTDQDDTEFGEFLHNAMELAELAETWAIEIRRQAHVFLEDSGKIRGWKLVPKRGTRQWIDAAQVSTEMLKIGALPEDVWTEPELRSVAQLEKAVAKRGIKIPAELHHTVSTGTTIARSDDKRPESSRATVVEDLRKALKAL